MKKDILTTNEVAAQLSCARTSIINWVNQGELVSFETPGGHRRFKREDIISLEKGTITFNVNALP